MLATIIILVITVALVQVAGDALVRYTTPHQRAWPQPARCDDAPSLS